jgi:hypothetical protein
MVNDMYHLKWNDEVIESEIEGREYAEYLQTEYNLAFKGGVTLHDGPGE